MNTIIHFMSVTTIVVRYGWLGRLTNVHGAAKLRWPY